MVGERLSKLRKIHNMTQKALADELSVSINSISLYERDLSTPTDEVKLKMAQIFHVSLDYLMGNSKAPTTTEAANSSLVLMQQLPPEAFAEIKSFIDYLKEKYQFD